MGRATRWLKSLFGIKKDDKVQKEINQNPSNQREKVWAGLGHSGRETQTIPPNITPAEASWLTSFYSDFDKEQSKHGIAVAAATAAAADAAVAAAQAAVAVVRLTSQGRGGTMLGGGSREKWAVTKIQTVFRGFLARKALRALKGLVKLQALVRGYLVRKQAAATLHSMQALIRAQANVLAQKTQPQFDARKSVVKVDEARSKQNSFHNRRLSASFDSINSNAIDESPKIVEIDTGKPISRSRRSSCPWVSDSISGDDNTSGQTLSSPSPCPCPCRHLPPGVCRSSQDSDWGPIGDGCRFSTAQSTPRFSNSCGTNPAVTPAKSVCVESLFRGACGTCPNYMANTQSFKAKLRSYSAPKKRPELESKRRLSLHEMMESRSILSGVRKQRSCSQVQEVLSFKNAVIGRLGRSSEFSKEQLYNSQQGVLQEY